MKTHKKPTKEQARQYQQAYRERHPDKIYQMQHDYHEAHKDEINGGGNEHRRSIHGRRIYEWLKNNNYPEGFGVLCHNCNMAKGFYGYCPHQKESR